MDEALGEEATEQALHDAVLEVEVHDVFVDAFRRRRRRPDEWATPAAIGSRVLPSSRRLRSVSSVSAQVGSAPCRGVEIGKAETLRRLLRCRRRSSSGSAPSISSEQEIASRKLVVVEADPLPGIVESIAERVDLPLQRFPTIAGDFQFLVSDLLFFAVQVGRVDLLRELLGIGAADAVAQGVGEPVFEHLGEAAEFLADRLRSCARAPEARGPRGAACRRSSGSRPRRAGWSLRSMRPLRCSMRLGFHGHVEVEQVEAVGLEVQALAGGVGGDQDAQRMLVRRRLKARLIASRLSGGVGPWKISMRCSARSVPARAARSCLIEIPLGVVVLGEDEHAQVRPHRAGLRAAIAGQPGARAEVLANPFDEPAHPGIGQAASLIGDALHLVEELLFLRVVGSCCRRRRTRAWPLRSASS